MKNLKIRKTVLAMMASCLVSSSVLADDGIKITVFSSFDSTSKQFNVDDIRKISFNNDGITFLFKDAVQAEEFFEYGDVGSMKFSGVANGIDNVKTDSNGSISIAYDGHVLRVSGCESAQLRIFDIAGRPVICEAVSGEASISTDNLSSGVYILRVNNKTFKFNKI